MARKNELLPTEFLKAVLHHWGSLVTSGFGIGGLGIWPSTGHFVPHWIYWTMAALGLVVAFYKAWADQHHQVTVLRGQMDGELSKRRLELDQERRKELLRVIVVLRDLQVKVLYWRDLTNGKWGLAPPIGKILPNDWSTVSYEAEKITSALRTAVEQVGEKVVKAELLITEYQGVHASYRQDKLMASAYCLS